MRIYIYGLIDPQTQQIRYIGQTNNIKYRIWRHIRDAKAGSHLYVHKWIRKILSKGKNPKVTIIDICGTDKEVNEREIWWIAFGKRQGWKLTNCTDGGLGHRGFSPTQETRQKFSAISSARRHSEETKRKIGLAHQGSKSKNATINEDIAEQILTIWMRGTDSQRKIGRIFGISRILVGKITRGERWKHVARKIGYNPADYPAHTGKNSMITKLSEDKVRKIRELYKQREKNQPELARMFGVSSSVITRVINFDAWAWVI